MNLLGRILDRVTGRHADQRHSKAMRRAMAARYGVSNIDAAKTGGGSPGWTGTNSTHNEDAANKEYMQALPTVLQRSQDLDVNNPDLRGFHRARVAQIVGSHVKFKANPHPGEVGVHSDKLIGIKTELNRIRELHSRTGGFDSTNHNRSEGVQQVRAWLTAVIHGSCLIHRVWRPENKVLPLSIELIPGVRISTPIDRQGDPKLSYGIEYEDTHRTRVVAYHVRRVSNGIGDSFVPDFVWDRIPVEDASLLELIEPAGMDRSMPLAVATVRMLRNRGEMVESAVASARAQSKIYAAIECAPGASPWDVAAGDADQEGADARLAGFSSLGDVQAYYTMAGEKVNWNSAHLPQPDFKGFMDVTDSRLSRGLSSSLSRFTRNVNSSWAGGRLEDQQDDPIIDQYRQSFIDAWQRVNEWFVEAVWLTSAVDLPNYSTATAMYWAECRAQFPGKLHINPQDTMAARETGYRLRTQTPQQSCEEDGKDLESNLRQWAEAMQAAKKYEEEYGLPEGSLNYLISGATLSTAAGEEVGAATPIKEGEQPQLKMAAYRAGGVR